MTSFRFFLSYASYARNGNHPFNKSSALAETGKVVMMNVRHDFDCVLLTLNRGLISRIGRKKNTYIIFDGGDDFISEEYN